MRKTLAKMLPLVKKGVRSGRMKKRFYKKWWLWAGMIILGICIAGIGYLIHAATTVSNATKSAHIELDRGSLSDKRIKPFDPGKDQFTILLLGIDARMSKGETVSQARSDAIVLALFNQKEKTAKLLSIPRDTYVNIPGYGYDKIAHAHAYGGLDLSVKTVENLLNLPVDDAVEANFTAFKSVINALDGVDVNIDKAYIVKQIKKETHGKVKLKTGAQLMNGEEALAYVRTRKADTDLLRGQRQMQVLKAIERKMKTLSAFPKYEKIASILGDNMKMTMSFKDAIGLYPLVSSLKSVETLQLKGSDYQPGKVYYLKLDEPYLQNLKQKLRNYLGINK